MSPVVFGLLAAVLAQGALALGLMFYLGTIRVPMIARGEAKLRDIATSRAGWPAREHQVSNAVDNQFQLPLLFYVAVGVALYLGAGWLELLLAWGFVVSRYVHAVIHVTRNNVLQRFWVFTAGLGLLTLVWLLLAIRLVATLLG